MKQIVFATAATLALVLTNASSTLSADYPPQYAPQNMPQYGAPYGPQYGSHFGQNYRPAYRPTPQQTAPQQAAPQADSPSAKVAAQLGKLRAFLTKTQGGSGGQAINPEAALSYIENQIAPDIDFQTMTQMALGRLANRMTPQQRTAAQNALKRNFVSKLVEAMGDIRATRFTVGKTRRGASRGELVVPVRLDRWRGKPMTIKFRFYKSKDGWKVFDAEAAGQSAVLFYRGYFARQWRQG